MRSVVCLIYSRIVSQPLKNRLIIPASSHIVFKSRSISKMAVVENPRIGVCQFTGIEDKAENLATCYNLIKKAASYGAKMVFLPEACDYIAKSTAASVSLAETIEGPTISQFREIAKDTGVWLSFGIHQKSETDAARIYNTHVLIDDAGEVKATYNKLHLFDLDLKGQVKLHESSYTIPGLSIHEPIATPIGKLGLATCYDLRFPEMAIALRQQGAEILTYPSAFTQTTGQAHWEVLLRSRAIENQCYVVASAHTGKHNDKRSSYGHSMVVDPWGTVVAECKEGTDVCIAEVDLNYLHKLRQEMPVQNHKRTDIYTPVHSFIAGCIDDRESYEFGQYKVTSTQVFYKTGLTYAFVNLKPILPGHLLVAPIRPAKRFCDLTSDETSDIFNVTRRVSEICQKHFSGTALTVAIQDGADAGQTVEHVHVHILPRRPGDFPFNDSVYNELEKHDKEMMNSEELRTEEDMKKEAAELRAYFVL